MNLTRWYLVQGVVVAGAFALMGLGLWRQRKRAQALKRLALRLGLPYQARDDQLPAQFPDLPLFGRGHSRQARNVLRGSAPLLAVFDYQFTVGYGRSRTTYRQTVAAFALGKAVPAFTLQPEGWLQKLSEVFGNRDIDIEAHPAFSQRYCLKGKDERAVRALFQPGLLQALMRSPDWCVEGSGLRLACFRRLEVKPEELMKFIDEATRLVGEFGGAAGGF